MMLVSAKNKMIEVMTLKHDFSRQSKWNKLKFCEQDLKINRIHLADRFFERLPSYVFPKTYLLNKFCYSWDTAYKISASSINSVMWNRVLKSKTQSMYFLRKLTFCRNDVELQDRNQFQWNSQSAEIKGRSNSEYPSQSF